MKIPNRFCAFLIFSTIIISCIPEKLQPPVITTAGINSITYNSASTGGTVTISEGTTVSSVGICWNTTGSPTIDDNKTECGTKAGGFNAILSPLKVNTSYFARAYAVSNTGTSYGNEQTFTTPNPKVYIRARFGTESLECYYGLESVNNYYDYTDKQVENRFYLKMYNNVNYEKSKEIQIDINRINKDTLRTPWENKLPIIYPETYVNLYIVDYQRASDFWGIYDSINYYGAGLSKDPVFVKITQVLGDTIHGTFHGTLKTPTGRIKEMTDGEFKIRFKTIVGKWK